MMNNLYLRKVKYFYLIFLNILLINTNIGVSQILNSEREIYARNRVLKCEIYNIPYKFGKADTKDNKLIKTIIFINGYIRWEGFFTTGKSRDYKYDDNFYLKEIVVEYSDEWNHKRKETHEIVYDDFQKPIKELVYLKNGKLEYKVEYKYDSLSNIIEDKIIESDGSISKHNKYVYQYDNLSNITKKENYSYDDYSKKWTLDNFIAYTYNPTGNLSEQKTYTPNSDKFKRVEYFYENNGLLAGKTFYNTEGEAEYDELNLYKYNE